MAYSIVHHYSFALGAGPFTITSSTAGNLISVQIYWSDSSNTNPTFTDNAGGGSNTYTPCQTKVTSGTNESTNGFYAKNINAGATAISIAWSNGAPGSGQIFVQEISGLDPSSPYVTSTGQEQSAPGTGTGAVTSGLSNVTSAPAVVIGYCADYQSGTITPTAGETQLDQAGTGTSMHFRVTSTGNQQINGTTNFGTDNHISFMASYKETVVAVALAGQPVPTTGGSGGTSGGSSQVWWHTFTAYASGTATALNAYLTSVGVATGYQMGLYDVNGNLLASTANLGTPTVGLNTGTISNVPIVYGQQYSLAWQASSSIGLADDNTGFKANYGTNTFGTMPSTLPSSSGGAIGVPSIYVSGTLGAGAAGKPLGGPGRTQMHWR